MNRLYLKIVLILLVSALPTASHSYLYNINFMWVNRSIKPDQCFICPGSQDEVYEKLLTPLFRWSHAHDNDCTIVLWYDSALTCQYAVKNTQELINHFNFARPSSSAPIILQDIRQLNYVTQHSQIFSPALPVYFRVDLSRIIATFESLETTPIEYFVYMDLDVESVLNKEELFDPVTLSYLDTYAIVVREGGKLGFENQFHIVKKGNANLTEAIKHALIELNIARGYKALAGEYYEKDPKAAQGCLKALQESVFNSYIPMFKYFYSLEGYGTLEVGTTKTLYDKNRDGFMPFSVDHFDVWGLIFHTAGAITIGKDNQPWIPTKVINFPPPSLNYD